MTLIERLRERDYWLARAQLACEAADLLESQAARIAELEARLESVAEEGAIRGLLLAALRRKIVEAPVVAWWYPKAGKAIPAGRLYWDDRKEMTEAGTKLISKEDLQK